MGRSRTNHSWLQLVLRDAAKSMQRYRRPRPVEGADGYDCRSVRTKTGTASPSPFLHSAAIAYGSTGSNSTGCGAGRPFTWRCTSFHFASVAKARAVSLVAGKRSHLGPQPPTFLRFLLPVRRTWRLDSSLWLFPSNFDLQLSVPAMSPYPLLPTFLACTSARNPPHA